MKRSTQDLLAKVQTWGLLSFVSVVVCYPVVSICWDLATFLDPGIEIRHVLFGRFMSGWDAGAQSHFSRSIYRLVLGVGCLWGLGLPSRRRLGGSGWGRRFPWGAVFLLCGVVSCSLSSAPYRAETEWETWALLLLFGALLERSQPDSLLRVLAGSVYLTAGALYLQALWIAIPATVGRLGGAFSHANALSSFTLVVLPFLIWRSQRKGIEAVAAAFLVGTTVALQIWSGSLTGSCLLAASLVYFALPGSKGLRVVVSLLALVLPFLFNASGGWLGVLGFPLLFLSALLGAVVVQQKTMLFRHTVLALASLALGLASFTMLSPESGQTGMIHSRANSGAARLEFYRAGASLLGESPLLGHGPGSFGRLYPSQQFSIQYFSKFVHCIPLEVALEWGLGALVLGVAGIVVGLRRGRRAPSQREEVLLWTLLLFFGHCLTGVQTQFPYLGGMVVVMWASLLTTEDSEEPCSGPSIVTRVLLALGVCALIGLNLWRTAHIFERDFALYLLRTVGPAAAAPAEQLLKNSAQSFPVDGDTWLNWAQLAYSRGDRSTAAILSAVAMESDPLWAAPRELKMLSSEPLTARSMVAEALRLDPVNYPLFYRLEAEQKLQLLGPAVALDRLLERASQYDPLVLAALPDFRSEDLEEQLVEYWLLIAILLEGEGRLPEAESAFRKSLHFADKRLSRLRAMIDYPGSSGLRAGPMVSELIAQLAQQVPAKDIPVPVERSPDESFDL